MRTMREIMEAFKSNAIADAMESALKQRLDAGGFDISDWSRIRSDIMNDAVVTDRATILMLGQEFPISTRSQAG